MRKFLLEDGHSKSLLEASIFDYDDQRVRSKIESKKVRAGGLKRNMRASS